MSGYPRSAPTFHVNEAPSNYKAGMGRGGKGGLGFSTRGDIGPASSVPGAIQGGRGPPSSVAGAPGGELFIDSKFGAAPKGYVAGRGRGMGALARENGEVKDEESRNRTSIGNGYTDRMRGGNGLSIDPYDQDDDEADKIYANVDEVMAGRHKRKHASKDKDGHAHDPKKPRIAEQFVDLKQNLGSLTTADWDAIPEVGDSSLKYTQQRRFQNVYVPLPDNIISGTASKLSGGDNFVTQDLTEGEVIGADSSAALSKGRTDGLISKLDRMSDSVSGQTVVDPRGYMTSLDSLTGSGMTEINDIKKARMLLGSVTSSNPKHAPGWIAAARVEEVAGKLNTARKIIKQGCDKCPQSEDLWLESVRLNSGDDAKAVLAGAVQHNPTSVSLWRKAASVEESKEKRRIVYRKALEYVPDSVDLWKGAIELEPSADDARIMLERAVECVPQAVDMWLALAKLESYENARNILNQAREALPHERSIWITAASLEEAYKNNQLVDKIISKMVSFLSKDEIIIDRQDWIRDAQKAEASQSLRVCDSIVKHTIGLDVEDEDRLVTWIDDAESCLRADSFELDGKTIAFANTARSIYNHALSIFPTKHVLWLGLASLEKQHGSLDNLTSVLERAVEQCPKAELLWLMAAKHKWVSLKDVAAARGLLHRAIQHNTDSEEIWLAAGKLESETGNVDKAREMYRRGRKALPSRPRLWMKSALMEIELNKHEDALYLIDEGVEKFPTFYKFYLMGAACSASKSDHRRRTGSEFLKKGVLACLSPDDQGNDILSIELARVEESESGPNKARSVLELARMKLPKSQQLWLEAIRLEHRHENETLRETLIARAKQECGDHAGLIWAEDLLTCSKPAFKSKSVDALKKCDNDPHVILAIARVFERDAKYDKARKWYQRVCEMNPKLGDAWCYRYAFEVQQEALKQNSSKIKNTQGLSSGLSSVSSMASVEKACVDADPNQGERWNSYRKKTSHRREPVVKILQEVAKNILSQKRIRQ